MDSGLHNSEPPLPGPRVSVEAGKNITQWGDLCQVSLALAPKLAILMAMAMAEHISLAEVKNRLSEVVDRIQRSHGRVIITKHGHPSVVLMSLEDLESLEETLEILGNPRLMSEIRRADAEVDARKTKRLSKEDALRLAKRG